MICNKEWNGQVAHRIIRGKGIPDIKDMVHRCKLKSHHEGKCVCYCGYVMGEFDGDEK